MNVLAMILVFSIPIIAILSWAYTETQKQKLEAGAADIKKLQEKIEDIQEENLSLHERIENLETIITNIDEDVLKINSQLNDTQTVAELAEKLKSVEG